MQLPGHSLPLLLGASTRTRMREENMIARSFLRMISAMFFCYVVGAATSEARAVLTYVTDSTKPGRLCTIVGDGWAEGGLQVRAWLLPDGEPGRPAAGVPSVAVRDAKRVRVLHKAPQVLTAELPSGEFGVWAIQVGGAHGWSKPFLINRARADWLSTESCGARRGCARARSQPGRTRTLRPVGR